jgi:hypothetical protein
MREMNDYHHNHGRMYLSNRDSNNLRTMAMTTNDYSNSASTKKREYQNLCCSLNNINKYCHICALEMVKCPTCHRAGERCPLCLLQITFPINHTLTRSSSDGSSHYTYENELCANQDNIDIRLSSNVWNTITTSTTTRSVTSTSSDYVVDNFDDCIIAFELK